MQPLAVLRKQQPPAVESCRVDRAGRNSGSRSPKSINTHHHRPMLPRSFFCDVGASFRRLLARRIDSIARGPRRFSTCSPVPADAAAVDADAPVVAAPPHSLVCGVDEAGRGAVLGPLVIGACVLSPAQEALLTRAGVRDSKELSPSARERLAAVIRDNCIAWRTFHIEAHEIDERRAGKVNLNEIEYRAMVLLLKSVRHTHAHAHERAHLTSWAQQAAATAAAAAEAAAAATASAAPGASSALPSHTFAHANANSSIADHYHLDIPAANADSAPVPVVSASEVPSPSPSPLPSPSLPPPPSPARPIIDRLQIDSVESNAPRLQSRFQAEFPAHVRVLCENRADARYVAVAAASILAKTDRDRRLAELQTKLHVRIGSGYPHDAATRAFMRGAHARRALGESPLPYVRYSWAMNLPPTPSDATVADVTAADATVGIVSNATVHARIDAKTSADMAGVAGAVSVPAATAASQSNTGASVSPQTTPLSHDLVVSLPAAAHSAMPPPPPPPKPSKAAASTAQATAMQTKPTPTQPSQATVTRTFAPALRRSVVGAGASADRPFAARSAKPKVAEPPPIDIPADLVAHFERIVME